MPAFPVEDPQFWIVSLATAGAVAFAAWRLVRRSVRAEVPCASCPQARPAASRPVERAAARSLPVLALLLALGAAVPARAESVERRVEAMGTMLTVVVEGLSRERALELAEALIAEVRATEARLSTWREDSELAAFNRSAPGAPVILSPPTWRALSESLRCAAETDGAFDPTIAPLVELWGLRTGGRRPTDVEIDVARAMVGYTGFELAEPSRTAVRNHGGVRIEEGGFGKGAALAEALRVARERAPDAAVRLDLGGQLAWTGERRAVVVGVADPRLRDREVLEIVIDRPESSIATSSNTERAGTVDGERIGHLLDPRTGRPAPDFGSASSIDSSPTLADCRATGLFVLGPQGARREIAGAENQGDDVLLVVEGEHLRALVSPRLEGRVRALVSEVTIEVVPGMR
jgi:thiamine biosynthesis lipoprotein